MRPTSLVTRMPLLCCKDDDTMRTDDPRPDGSRCCAATACVAAGLAKPAPDCILGQTRTRCAPTSLVPTAPAPVLAHHVPQHDTDVVVVTGLVTTIFAGKPRRRGSCACTCSHMHDGEPSPSRLLLHA